MLAEAVKVFIGCIEAATSNETGELVSQTLQDTHTYRDEDPEFGRHTPVPERQRKVFLGRVGIGKIFVDDETKAQTEAPNVKHGNGNDRFNPTAL